MEFKEEGVRCGWGEGMRAPWYWEVIFKKTLPRSIFFHKNSIFDSYAFELKKRGYIT